MRTAKPRKLRPRVQFGDADCVAERVRAHAADMGLRGARRWVLAAVLTMLCTQWSKVTDDEMRLRQLVEAVVAAGGRRYDLKTIGRALASLAADELIVYRPARGRGRHAFVAIHARFVGAVQVLERDSKGAVIVDYSGRSEVESVTFSKPCPYIDQRNYLPTLRNDTQLETSRPTEVEVPKGELKTVMAGLPEPMAALPQRLRWKLGSEVLQRLKRGWRADQILAVLKAEMPDHVQRPYTLAVWRLQRNIVGSGPRLRPQQQAWDVQAAATARAEAEDAKTRRYAELAAVTTADLRAKALLASEVTFKRSVSDPVAALAVVARRASAKFPAVPVAEAMARWADSVLADHKSEPVAAEPVAAVRSLSTDLLMDMAISGGCTCVMCGSARGIHRPQLPLESMSTVCDRCWPHIDADLAAGEHAAELEEAIPA